MRENPSSGSSGGGGPVAGRWSSGRLLITFLLSFFLFFMFRNMITKDYKTETKSYLTKIGRSDAIDRVVPKTATVSNYLFISSS
jgi:phosphate starvation-inducible membrane PsiE